MDGRLAGTLQLAGRGRRWTAWTEINFENDVSGTATNLKSALQLKMVMLWNEILLSLFCENYILWNGNLGLKMGVSRTAHT